MHVNDILRGPLPDVRVGIGCASAQRSYDNSVVIYTDPDELTDDLRSGRIDAAVRGDMSSSVLLPKIKSAFGLNELQRTVIMEPAGRKMIFITPVGIDEGWTVKQKIDLAEKSVRLMRRLRMDERIAVMSGGREEDIGRHAGTDASIDNAKTVVRMLREKGYDAYHAQILIESAADEADLIIAPDGICGNLIFRTLHFMGNAKALGAPVINMEKVFVDTSRAKTDYTDSIALAKRLTEVQDDP